MNAQRLLAAAVLAAATVLSACAAPVTLIERAVEARSTSDIVKDNNIVIDVNRIMAELGTIKASTEIYEQRLLVTGLFDKKDLYDDFLAKVNEVQDVRALYWHVVYLNPAEQETRKAELIDWPDAMILDNKVGLQLIGAAGVSDVNLRVAADAFSTVYLLGRARHQGELDKAIRLARETAGAKKIVNYIELRP